jgi:hypothetical protein
VFFAELLLAIVSAVLSLPWQKLCFANRGAASDRLAGEVSSEQASEN